MARLPELTAAMLHPQAAGRWLDIFQYLCPGMFDDAIRNLGVHVTCPFHGGEEDFRFVKTAKKYGNTPETGVAMCTCGSYPDGFAVLQRAKGGRFIDILKEVDEYLNGPVDQRVPPPSKTFVPPVKSSSAADQAAKDAESLRKVNALWSSGRKLDLGATPYYVERGLDCRVLNDLRDVRSVSTLPYWSLVKNKPTKLGTFPALLALMRDHLGNPVAVHRTWLSSDRRGKAPGVPKAKKLSETPGAAGAAIRLFEAKGTDVLGLTEGIETGCAVRQLATGGYWPELGRIPVWAAYSERNIRNFIVPEDLLPTLRKIIIFADMDENWTGIKAAKEFQERMVVEHPDIEVVIKVPHVIGWDWLDVLISL